MSDLDNEFERVGRILAADRDLKITVAGVDAYAKPGQINIPSIDNFDWLGADAKRMMHGLLDHECAHAKYTDHSRMPVAHKMGGKALATLYNAIEDGWIEKRIGLEYPGARQNLAQKNQWFWTDPKWQTKFARNDEWSAFCTALTLVLRGAITIDDVRAKRADVAKRLDEIPSWLRKAQACSSSKAALGVAKGIFDHFTMEPEPPPPPTSEESGGEEEGEEPPPPGAGGAPEPSDGEGEPEGAEGEGESPEGSEAPGEAEKGDDEDGPTPDVMYLNDWQPSGPLNPEQAIKTVIDRRLEDGTMPYVVFSHDFDIERDFYRDPMKVRGGDTLAAILRDAHKTSDALADAFEAALRARRDKHPVAGADEGDVDEALLAEYAVGAADVDTIYRQWVADDDRDVAVAILVDCSGSMSSKESLARRSAAALSLALTRVQIAHEITGFTTVISSMGGGLWMSDKTSVLRENFATMRAALADAHAHGRNPEVFARELYGGSWPHSDLQVPAYGVFKPYDVDSLDGLLHACASAENLDGEAVLWQARRLARRPEPRRVMFVLSDGMPAGHRRHANGSEFLKETVSRVIDAGIEVYGIGMMSNAVSRFYPRYWIAKSMEDLTSIALGSLTEVLTQARDERACVRI